jgi:hypothetical protein
MGFRLLTGIRLTYLFAAWLFVLGMGFQVLLVGLGLFAAKPAWNTHMGLGHWIGCLPLLLVILSYISQFPPASRRLSWLLFGVYIAQAEIFAVLRRSFPLYAAFHPVLALVLFTLGLTVASNAWAWVRSPKRIQTTQSVPADPVVD